MKVKYVKEKMCPFISDSIRTNCICSSCMAWVYTYEKEAIDSQYLKYPIHTTIANSKEYQLRKKGYIDDGFDENGFNLTLYQELKEEDKEGYCTRLS